MWDTATNEPPPDESPECQWCPICQAARAARLSGPGLMSSVADVGGALAAMAQDAFSAFEQIIKTQDQNRSSERTGVTPAPKPDTVVPPAPKPDNVVPLTPKPDTVIPPAPKPDSEDPAQ